MPVRALRVMEGERLNVIIVILSVALLVVSIRLTAAVVKNATGVVVSAVSSTRPATFRVSKRCRLCGTGGHARVARHK